MTANLQVRRAYVLIQLDQVDQARKCLDDAEQYTRVNHEQSLNLYILYHRGAVLLARNQFEEAIAPLQESLRGAAKAGLNELAVDVMISLAWSYFRLGRFDNALGLYQEALTGTNKEDRHFVLGHLGNIFYEEGDFLRAAAYYRQAVSEAEGRNREFQAKWLNNLGEALIQQKNWVEAEQFNREALQLEKGIDNPQDQALALVNMGRIQVNKRDYQSAESTFRKVMEFRSYTAAILEADSLLADLYARTGRLKRAKSQLESALQLADQTSGSLREDENKLSYLSSLIDLHRQYVNFLMDRGDKKAAFAVAESSRARLLRERLNLPRSTTRTHSIAEYQAAARRSGTTFLAYWIGPEHSYLWAISPSKFAAYPLPPEREINDLVEQYQNSLEHGGTPRTDPNSPGAKLYQILLARHAGVLQRGGRYVIVPDGPLYALNFETLPVPGNPPHFWIEDATVAVAPSLDLLVTRHVPPRGDRSLLLVGDAVEWNPEFPKLLYAHKEMEGIEQQFSPAHRKVLDGSAATAAAYKESQPKGYAYIHFAAHATANRNSPLDSSIILSRENGSPSAPGKLSVNDVLNTPVDAELVTVSACHSAGARTYWGEGLVGFTWAFLRSGARNVIAGLWDVSDYSSPRLMRNLYAGLAGSQAPADALRAAKLQLIREGKYASPYYWGALQLYEGALTGPGLPHPAGVASAALRR